MTTETADAKIAELEALLPELTERDRIFAESLINGKWGYRRRGFLSAKQWPYVDQLIERGKQKNGEPDNFSVDLTKVHAFLMQARKTLKHPKVWMRIGNRDLKVYLSGKRSKYPDCVNLVVYDLVDGWRQDTWLGRILPDGTWHRPFTTKQADVDTILPALGRLADDPGPVAQEYGRLTGKCCFCNHVLTDEDHSTKVGFGPVCAKRYGLAEFWKAGNGTVAHVAMAIQGTRPDMVQ